VQPITERVEARRELRLVETLLGGLPRKRIFGRRIISPSGYDDCLRLARENNSPAEVFQAVQKTLRIKDAVTDPPAAS
jgi:hypothetical protein